MKSFKFTAFGQEWQVKVLKKHPELEGHFGNTNLNKNIVYISSELKNDQQLSTLLHEIIHIVEFSLSVKMIKNEKDTRKFEAGLFQIIHDNKIKFW